MRIKEEEEEKDRRAHRKTFYYEINFEYQINFNSESMHHHQE
jgi:hypothetical protein